MEPSKTKCCLSRNFTHMIDDVLKLTHEVKVEITVSAWKKTCHVANIVDEYRQIDIVIDEQIEILIIVLVDSIDSDSDNDDNA